MATVTRYTTEDGRATGITAETPMAKEINGVLREIRDAHDRMLASLEHLGQLCDVRDLNMLREELRQETTYLLGRAGAFRSIADDLDGLRAKAVAETEGAEA